MKLNLREIKALAEVLSDEISNALELKKKETLKSYKPSDRYKALSRKLDRYNKITEELNNEFGLHFGTVNKKCYLEHIILEETELSDNPRVRAGFIEKDIILAQISCSGIEAIKEIVKDKYL